MTFESLDLGDFSQANLDQKGDMLAQYLDELIAITLNRPGKGYHNHTKRVMLLNNRYKTFMQHISDRQKRVEKMRRGAMLLELLHKRGSQANKNKHLVKLKQTHAWIEMMDPTSVDAEMVSGAVSAAEAREEFTIEEEVTRFVTAVQEALDQVMIDVNNLSYELGIDKKTLDEWVKDPEIQNSPYKN